MGHYHGDFPENVQRNKKRHYCGICDKKKYEKFMLPVRWLPFAWVCNSCKNKLDKRYWEDRDNF